MRAMVCRFLSLSALLIALLPTATRAQTTAQAEPKPDGVAVQAPTLRTTTRLVIVDVVALDAKGRPVADLKQDDFSVTEDSEPQRIIDFTFHRPAVIEKIERHLPPGVITNAPQFKNNSCLNIILLDALNTDFRSRVYAQDMLIKFLGDATEVQPTAVFALETKLTLLHDFTTDPKVIRQTLLHFQPRVPTHLPTVGAAASAFGNSGSFQSSAYTREVTFSAISYLAHALSGYPGRKNLIWLSEGFPLNLFPDSTLDGGGPVLMQDFSATVAKIADELMSAQVAVYPIDAAGVTLNSRFGVRTAMQSVADRTGGKTFYNRNDIEIGVRTSVDDGSTYYTLEYYPQNKTWDGKFRRIEVKLKRPGIKLKYREGYYALEPAQIARDTLELVADDFSHAMSMDAPASTAVLFQAAVIPSPDDRLKITVNFAVDPHSIHFAPGDDNLQHAQLSCIAWAYTPGKKPERSEGEFRAALTVEQYQGIMQGYFPCRRTLELKPGRYTLRLGVLDRASNHIGTLSTQVTIP